MAGMHQVLGSDDPPAAQLHDLVDFQVGFFRKNPHFGRLYLRYSSIALLAHVNDDVDPAITDRYETSMQMQTDMFRKGQTDGTLRAGDPVVLGRLFSGLMATFQSVDPLVVSDDPDSHEQLSLAEFHDLVDGAFRA
jgi:TetR/AcrR family transcriptional regulator